MGNMKSICKITPWAHAGVVEALLVNNHAIFRARSLNAQPKYGGAFHFDGLLMWLSWRKWN